MFVPGWMDGLNCVFFSLLLVKLDSSDNQLSKVRSDSLHSPFEEVLFNLDPSPRASQRHQLKKSLTFIRISTDTFSNV